ncbi:MAG: NYN domain-containing protein [Nitriliruptoraceae bacterium]
MGDDRVILFIDYENMSRCARSEFGVDGHFWPWQLGQLLVDRRNQRTDTARSVLHQVRVYRGLPDARKQPESNAKNQAQTAAWMTRCPEPERLVVCRRPLRYPRAWGEPGAERPQEKGVDVWLAVDLVQMTYRGEYDTAIVCSHDSDLAPALDTVKAVTTVRHHLEVVAWARSKRISYSDDPQLPWRHRLTRHDYDSIEDPVDYA